jgi:hypothetical protein
LHICYEYDRCFAIFFVLFFTYYHHVICVPDKDILTAVKRIFHRRRWCSYCSVCLSLLYMCVCASVCKNRPSDQMISVGVPTCFASNALFSFWQLDAFLSLLFCGKRVVRFISLSVLHIKNIYFCIYKSYCFPLQWRCVFEKDEYIKTLYKKGEKKRKEYTWSDYFSFFLLVLLLFLWSFQSKEKEENTMIIMKIYFVRFYIAWDREKGRENTATENIWDDE